MKPDFQSQFGGTTVTYSQLADTKHCPHCGRLMVDRYDLSKLSLLEIATVRELAKGYWPSEVAAARNRSVKTIDATVWRIRVKMGIETRVQWMTLLRQFPGAE